MLAAAHETGVIAALEQALPTGEQVAPRLAHATPATRRQALLTLLFLGVAGLRRPWELRGYTGGALALLTGRRQAYGYFQCERFLAQVARAGGDEMLTDALAAWTAKLWPSEAPEPGQPLPAFYLDGHKKPVYTDHLIPRGLIGRTGKVLGCRALLLLHDAHGHPLFATTHRGDLHLTKEASAFLERYEQATDSSSLTRLIIDREGMAAELSFGVGCPGTHRRNHPPLQSVSGACFFHRGRGLCAAVPGRRRTGDARGSECQICLAPPGSSRPDAEAFSSSDS